MAEQGHIQRIAEAGSYVFAAWEESYHSYNDRTGALEAIAGEYLLDQIEEADGSLQEKCACLQDAYRKGIREASIPYVKEELLAGLFRVKEYLTVQMTKASGRLPYVEDERSSVNDLISLTHELREEEFSNEKITYLGPKGQAYLYSLFLLGRLYSLLKANRERIRLAEERGGVTLRNMAFDTIEDDSFRRFYDAFREQGFHEKIEDYKIVSPGIRMQVARRQVTPSDIRLKSSGMIRDIFGFGTEALGPIASFIGKVYFEDEASLWAYIEDENIMPSVMPVPRAFFYDVAEYVGIAGEEMDAILENFSIRNKEEAAIELSCFYCKGDKVYFGPLDLMQVFGMFEKFCLSGAHLEYYKKGPDYARLFTASQNAASTYFCYVMADMLLGAGYRMSMEKLSVDKSAALCPRVEVHCIPKGKKNLLKDGGRDLGDCDVLFLDEWKKQIVCVEFKFFRPGITYEQLYKSDRNKITKQVYEKLDQIRCREQTLRDNLPEVIYYLGGTAADYEVKTIIVLARQSLYVYSEEIRERIPYLFMTIQEFEEKIATHKI